ncbi:MAG: hypothetical protein HQ567_25525 [Candidatus Nealsonbacteria bacterium]|nr:hypothetical protein [Candidatus Nealsonbacteria bacterium]
MSDAFGGESAPKPKKKKKSSGSWFQQQPTGVKIGIAAGVAVPVLVLAIWGYMGDDKPAPRPMPPRKPTPDVADAGNNSADDTTTDDTTADDTTADDTTADDTTADDTTADDTTADDTAGDDAPTAPADENAEDEERPEDLAQWKKEHFYSARKEEDAKLIEAVALLGKPFAGKAMAGNAAGLLAGILPPPEKEVEPPEDDTNPRHRPRPRRSDPKLIEAVVAALDANGSTRAREILQDILAGRIPTDDDQAAVKITLEALAANPCLENERILFLAITTAEQMRGDDDAAPDDAAPDDETPDDETPDDETPDDTPTTPAVTASELREQAFKAAEPIASAKFRLALAKYLAKPDTPLLQRESFQPLIHERHPDNIEAQLYLYQREETSKATKMTLEEYFIVYSSQALAAVLGVEAEAVDPSRQSSYSRTESDQPATADPDLPYQIAARLWAASSVAAVQKRLGEVDSLEKADAQVLTLAATMPIESIRPLVLDVLRKQFDDGPKELISAGLSKSLVSDPALLPPLKMLVRKQTPSRTSSKDVRDNFVKIREEWEKYTKESIRTWCDRFHAVASAADATAPQASLPIKLPPDAKPTAQFHVRLPGSAAEKLGGVTPGPVDVHYIRIEETAKLKTRLGYYRRAIGTRGEPGQIDKAIWLDSYRVIPQTGNVLSIELLITQVEPPKEEDAAEPEDLVIEILAIQIKDPTKN